jgi:glyoxylase-like metal-dependent hydrolase (beta-lactamase superfamily II)
MKFLFSMLLLLTTAVRAGDPIFVPQPVMVTEGVYAIVGPLGQRSKENFGLNATYAFIQTSKGVVLIDSGASAYSAERLERAIKSVTAEPIKWVINTGSQDHRWLGNDYFSARGAVIHALAATSDTQKRYGRQHLQAIERFVGEQIKGTRVKFPDQTYNKAPVSIVLGGLEILLIQTDAHFPGDSMVYLPQKSVVVTGDLVYVERLLAVLPQSSVRKANASFKELEKLSPKFLIPGHGSPTTLARARKESGDYYKFLIANVGTAAQEMESMTETLDKFLAVPAFSHLVGFDMLHRRNMNLVFLDFEKNP